MAVDCSTPPPHLILNDSGGTICRRLYQVGIAVGDSESASATGGNSRHSPGGAALHGHTRHVMGGHEKVSGHSLDVRRPWNQGMVKIVKSKLKVTSLVKRKRTTSPPLSPQCTLLSSSFFSYIFVSNSVQCSYSVLFRIFFIIFVMAARCLIVTRWGLFLWDLQHTRESTLNKQINK